MATIIRQSYIDKIERYLGKGDSHRILRLGTLYSQSEDSFIPPHSSIRPSHNSSSYPLRYQSSPASSSQVSVR